MPPSPEEVIDLVSRDRARLVRNGRELLDVLSESLSRLEASFQGVTPSAQDVWDEMPTARGDPRVFRPKGETSLSDYIKRHLDRDLRGGGVILNREVEIRPAAGGNPGERTDILVDIVVPSTEPRQSERISAVIEVKGCWNPDLNHAMETQLADRYMAESGIQYGMYVVGWFHCPQWDGRDHRCRAAPKLTIEEARRQFDNQAAGLSNEGRLIRAVVLNAALR
jgi:hypothetical protein